MEFVEICELVSNCFADDTSFIADSEKLQNMVAKFARLQMCGRKRLKVHVENSKIDDKKMKVWVILLSI